MYLTDDADESSDVRDFITFREGKNIRLFSIRKRPARDLLFVIRFPLFNKIGSYSRVFTLFFVFS